MFCFEVTFYTLRNSVSFAQFKKVKNTHGGVLLLVKLLALLKVTLLRGFFHVFKNCTIYTKPRKASLILFWDCTGFLVLVLVQVL